MRDSSRARGPEPADQDEISLFEIGGTILRDRWRIARWVAIGGALALVPAFLRKPIYSASASFVPQMVESDAAPSGLRNLAGQFGISVGGGSSGQSPQFYADLIKSPVILAPIAADSFSVPEEGKGRKAFLDLMNVKSGSRNRRTEQGVEILRSSISAEVTRETGVVMLTAKSRWPTLAAEVAKGVLDGVNLFNLRTRQTQASQERRFTEARLAEARQVLRDAEDRLQIFLQRNRQVQGSPELSFQRDRLQREVGIQQEIVTSLSRSYEEVRIREVRDIPVITVIEQPSVPTRPDARGRIKLVLLGAFVGGFVGVLGAFAGRMVQRRRVAGDPDLEGFSEVMLEVKEEIARLSPWRRRRRIVGR